MILRRYDFCSYLVTIWHIASNIMVAHGSIKIKQAQHICLWLDPTAMLLHLRPPLITSTYFSYRFSHASLRHPIAMVLKYSVHKQVYSTITKWIICPHRIHQTNLVFQLVRPTILHPANGRFHRCHH